ncbi:EexN family lipoprotein [Bartonella machadoae]|uniref:EexN family lipoprotein n=1 Tax=Bartonella machadoae TaxID=2893471 RepID=UPI001F4D1A1C|nr:EexN family lipoprotein [Bartonella machadoae]UNE53878.1 EexN family lipoprotein [Bartonella machadoae]
MKKTIITTLLLCTGLITAGCEKTYSVAELKKDPKLMEEWIAKCGFAGTSKNCENLRLAQLELEKEYEAQAEERSRQAGEELDKAIKAYEAEQDAAYEKWKAEKKAREQAEKQQDGN